jgi:hypothetical protein
LATNLVPEDLGVTKLRRVDGEDWTRVLCEGDAVARVGETLVLRCIGVKGVDGDEAVLRVSMIVKETGGIVSVYNRAAAEYATTRLVWGDGDG